MNKGILYLFSICNTVDILQYSCKKVLVFLNTLATYKFSLLRPYHWIKSVQVNNSLKVALFIFCFIRN